MKRQSILVGVLMITALALSITLLTYPGQRSVKADMISTGGDYTMLTWGTGAAMSNVVTVIDNRRGIMLSYMLQGRELVLQNYVSLSSRFHPQPLR